MIVFAASELPTWRYTGIQDELRVNTWALRATMTNDLWITSLSPLSGAIFSGRNRDNRMKTNVAKCQTVHVNSLRGRGRDGDSFQFQNHFKFLSILIPTLDIVRETFLFQMENKIIDKWWKKKYIYIWVSQFRTSLEKDLEWTHVVNRKTIVNDIFLVARNDRSWFPSRDDLGTRRTEDKFLLRRDSHSSRGNTRREN